MKRFHCGCGQAVYFDSTECVHCGAELGFDPDRIEMRATGAGSSLVHCGNREKYAACNWLLAAGSHRQLCLACDLNRTIPNLDRPGNLERWRLLEKAKRRLCYSLLRRSIILRSRWRDDRDGLWFDFLEDQRSNAEVAEGFVTTGHFGGVITINVLEADDVARETARTALDEPYRTLLGHFRHEIGHYFWSFLFSESDEIASFREVFGDERVDYAESLRRYYASRSIQTNDDFISLYAASHPLEDWAETLAHLLHMEDTLETAHAYELTGPLAEDLDERLGQWLELAVVLNELNRSMGLADAYPFVISTPVRDKLRFTARMLEVLVTRYQALADPQRPESGSLSTHP